MLDCLDKRNIRDKTHTSCYAGLRRQKKHTRQDKDADSDDEEDGTDNVRS
jgi:hypothetical protein